VREIWKILQAHDRFRDLDKDPEVGQAKIPVLRVMNRGWEG
jgi:hypothetical protein